MGGDNGEAKRSEEWPRLKNDELKTMTFLDTKIGVSWMKGKSEGNPFLFSLLEFHFWSLTHSLSFKYIAE